MSAFLKSWLGDFLNPYVPSPQRALLGARNFVKKVWRSQPPLSEKRFHVVLTWLAGDGNGESTKPIEDAFRDIVGIHLSRSAHIVKASGARDDWEPAMRKRAREILTDWQADLAIVGEVKDSQKVLSLWFVPRVGDGTLSRGDRGSNYVLKDVTLGDDFREDFQAQVAAMALSAVAPLVINEARGQILDAGLSTIAEQINTLIKKDSGPVVEPAERVRRAGLHMVLGNALQTLGERESGTERLEHAVAAYNAALEEYTRERVPLDWAMTQHNLGTALRTLGEREGDTDLLERAVNAHKAALEVKWPDRGDYLRSNAVNKPTNYILQVLKQPIVWVVGALLVPWLSGAFNSYMLSPQRAFLVVSNFVENVRPQPLPEEHFHVVLSWLEDDDSGDITKSVKEASQGIAGIYLSRSARIVKASGARGGLGIPAMRERTDEILADWKADLAIVGDVNKLEKEPISLDLWFVPHVGDGTPSPKGGVSDYMLKNVPIENIFNEEFRARLAAMVLSAMVPLVNNEARGKILDAGLSTVMEQLNTLLKKDSSSIVDRAGVQTALGTANAALGKRKSNPDRFKQAIAAYKAALKEYTRERAPLDWARTQNDLGNALLTLGERESGPERLEHLEQAVAAYKAALQVYTRERVPLDWATTQNNLGAVLATLGENESSTDRLEEAVAAYKAALKVYTRERVPLDWAMTQNNLGNAFRNLGKRGNDAELLEQAVAAHKAALKEYTRERVPLDWAVAQNSLGIALVVLGDIGNDTEHLDRAIAAYNEALKEFTRERAPYDWARTQNNLGNALLALDERESDTEHLTLAVVAYNEALKELTRERAPLEWATTQNNLGNALQTLGERESSTEHLKQAVAAYNEVLKEFIREHVPLYWAATQNNLGAVLATLGELEVTLGERESGTERLKQAVVAYNEVLKEYTHDRMPLDWARTQNNLGNVLATLSKWEIGTEHLEQAVAAYNAALEVFSLDQTSEYWKVVQSNLRLAREALNKRRAEP